MLLAIFGCRLLGFGDLDHAKGGDKWLMSQLKEKHTY
jgi:hypothetical protein